jgi:hypothetical protein
MADSGSGVGSGWALTMGSPPHDVNGIEANKQAIKNRRFG